MSTYPRWSHDKTHALHLLHRQGLTDPEIARRLGITLRAAIGKRQREDLPVNKQRRPSRTFVLHLDAAE